MIDAKEEAPAAVPTWGLKQLDTVQSGPAGLNQRAPRAAGQLVGGHLVGGDATEQPGAGGVMTAPADPVWSAIRGCQAAQEAIAEVRTGHAPPDALFDALQAAVSTGDTDLLRAFARQIQKSFEGCR